MTEINGFIIPKGYKVIPWKNLKEDEEVWLIGTHLKEPCTYGPHYVVSVDNRCLKNKKGKAFTHFPDDLLIKIPKFDGYKEAQLIEDHIMELLKKYPLNKKTCLEWGKMLRTLQQTFTILFEEAKHEVKKHYSQEAILGKGK